MPNGSNIFACLVHEQESCIIDMVRNLRILDPSSRIILYNGGQDTELLTRFPYERYRVEVHPNPRPLKWGWLHDFALDVMAYALESGAFETLTIVDSDQLIIRKGFSEHLRQYLQDKPNAGMLVQTVERQDIYTKIDPAKTAMQEASLWRPLMDALPGGQDAFLHWTFWPSTVFTRQACEALLALFRENDLLQRILKQTRIWASEEILFPTLTKALGFELYPNVSSYNYVKYRQHYTESEVQHALQDPNSFWMHPVPRDLKDPIRKQIAGTFGHYMPQANPDSSFPKDWLIRVVEQVQGIEGWLSEAEAHTLATTVHNLLTRRGSLTIAEIGSYCGKATALMALTCKQVRDASANIFAIDPYDGKLGAEDQDLQWVQPSFSTFLGHMDRLGIREMVHPIQSRSTNVKWQHGQIDLLVIDGLHDYANVARDFFHYEPHLSEEALIVFHDYQDYFPGVKAFVQERIQEEPYQKIALVEGLFVMAKRSRHEGQTARAGQERSLQPKPLVSCIMPTYNRAHVVAKAIDQFLAQTYPNKELIILDDSDQSIEALIPDREEIQYIRLEQKRVLGEKRNLACECAKGTYIVHWDDDDWYAKDWLEHQVATLGQPGVDVTGLCNPYFFDPLHNQAWQYLYPPYERPWVHGATLGYSKSFWEKNPFPALRIGEDSQFLWSHKTKHIQAHEHVHSYVGRIHLHNTSPKQTEGVRWRAVPKEEWETLQKDKSSQVLNLSKNIHVT